MPIAPPTARGNERMRPIERGGEPEQQRLGADRHELGRALLRSRRG